MARKSVTIPSVAAAVTALLSPVGTAGAAVVSTDHPFEGHGAQAKVAAPTAKVPVGEDLMHFTVGHHQDGRVVAQHESHASHASHASGQ